MIKKRIIGVLIVRQNILVQSIGFKKYLPIGNPLIGIEYLNKWGIDEIILIDVSARKEGRCIDRKAVYEYSEYCQVPLAIGGGINSVSDVDLIIKSGADKIVIGLGDFKSNKEKFKALIKNISKKYGNQSLVISIDTIDFNGKYYVYNYLNNQVLMLDPVTVAKEIESFGVGELFVQFISRDGRKIGYDKQYLNKLASVVNVPVIACGGASCPKDFYNILQTNISAAAAANYFNYSEHNVITLKRYLKDNKLSVRLDTYTDYKNIIVNDSGRVNKIDDNELERLRFEYIPEEVI